MTSTYSLWDLVTHVLCVPDEFQINTLLFCMKSAVMHEQKNIQVLKMMPEMVRFQTGDKKC